MTRLSSLIVLSAAALALAAPAFAKITVQSAEGLCKTEIRKKQADLQFLKVDKDLPRATGAAFIYTFKIKNADDTPGKLVCTVDRGADTVSSIVPAAS